MWTPTSAASPRCWHAPPSSPCPRPAGALRTTSGGVRSPGSCRSARRWSDGWDERLAEYRRPTSRLARRRYRRGEVRASRPGRAGDLDDHAPHRLRPPGRVRDRPGERQARRVRRQAAAVRRRRGRRTGAAVALLLADVRALLPVVGLRLRRHSTSPRTRTRWCGSPRTPYGSPTVVRDRAGPARSSCRRHRFDDMTARRRRPTRSPRWTDAARALLGEDFRIYPEFSAADGAGRRAGQGGSGVDLGRAVRLPDEPHRSGPRARRLPRRRVALRGRPGAREAARLGAGGDVRRRPRRARARAARRAAAVHRPTTGGSGSTSRRRSTSTATGCSTPPTTPWPSTRPRRSAGCCSTSGPRRSRCQSVDTGIAFHHDRPELRGAAGDAARDADRFPRRVAAGTTSSTRSTRRSTWPSGGRSSRRTSTTRPTRRSCPATVLATQVHQLTIAADLAFNNKIAVAGE